MILKAQALKTIPRNEIGLSKFQRDCLMISKDDEVMPKPAKIIDKNPLNSIDITVDVLFVDENYPRDQKGAFKVPEKDIFQALFALFNGMYLNKGEVAPLNLNGGQIILQIRVDKIENITAENRYQTYGVIEQQTIINCKPSKVVSQTLKITSDRMQER